MRQQHGGSVLGGVAITLQSVKLCASEVFIGAEIAVSSRATPVERSFHDAFFHGIARGKEEEEERWKDESKRSSRRGIDRRGIISSDLEENLIIILEEKRGAFVVPSCGGGVNNGAVVARHEWEFDDSTRSVFVRLESGQVRSMKGDRRFIKGWRIEICLG